MTSLVVWLSGVGPLMAGRAGLFLRVALACVLFVVAATALRRVRTASARAWGQIVVSVVLIDVLTTHTLTAIMVLYAVVFYGVVEILPAGPMRRGTIVGMLLLQVIGPIWWLPRLPEYVSVVRELVTFATNMTQLRCWAYAYDRRTRTPGAPPPFRDYALYMFFFPAFVSGPLVSFAEFQRGRLAWYWDDGPPALAAEARAEGHPIRRVLLGFAALPPVLALVPMMGLNGYQAATHGALPAWLQAIVIYFGVYLGFSAWSESAIGFGRLAGVRLPENFDHAHLSYGVADFWRRWNIRLGLWMRNYIYVPLGGAHAGRGGPVRGWANIGAVFLATALYHHIGGLKLLGPALFREPAFYAGWLLWAVWNTPATILTRTWRPPPSWSARRIAVVVATFLFSAMALLTAFFPIGMGLRPLGVIYRHLLFLP